jgi:hypothetical protein
MVATKPAPVKVNCLSWASRTLRNPDAPADHVAIALELQNSDTMSAWEEFVPPGAPPTPRPAPHLPLWGRLTAEERNARTITACRAMFHDEPGNLPSRQVAEATRTAIALTDEPNRTDVLARIRKAFAEALAPKGVIENDAPVQTEEPASSPLPSVSFSSPVIQAGRDSVVLILDGLDGTEMDAVTSAYHARFVPGLPATDQTEAQAAAREALRRCVASREVVVVWSADEPTTCPTCGVCEPSIDYSPSDAPTPEDRQYAAESNPRNRTGYEVRRSTKVLDFPHKTRTLPREPRRANNTLTDYDMVLAHGCV